MIPFLFIHPNHENWKSCQKLICAKVSLWYYNVSFPYQGSQSDLDDQKCVRSQYGSTIDLAKKKLILMLKPQKLKNRSFFERRDKICRSTAWIQLFTGEWRERKWKLFLYFYKCDSPQSQWIKYEFISHLVYIGVFSLAQWVVKYKNCSGGWSDSWSNF